MPHDVGILAWLRKPSAGGMAPRRTRPGAPPGAAQGDRSADGRERGGWPHAEERQGPAVRSGPGPRAGPGRWPRQRRRLRLDQVSGRGPGVVVVGCPAVGSARGPARDSGRGPPRDAAGPVTPGRRSGSGEKAGSVGGQDRVRGPGEPERTAARRLRRRAGAAVAGRPGAAAPRRPGAAAPRRPGAAAPRRPAIAAVPSAAADRRAGRSADRGPSRRPGLRAGDRPAVQPGRR